MDGSDCSGLALRLVPDEIPDATKTLDFSFNYLPALYNSTFHRLRSLVSLDLTRLEEMSHIPPKTAYRALDLTNAPVVLHTGAALLSFMRTSFNISPTLRV